MKLVVGTLLALALLGSAGGLHAPVQIFLVPHSHDDVGWTNTINGYYDTRVRSIYNTITDALGADPRRKFNAVEVAFLAKWWRNATTWSDRRRQFSELVRDGRVELLMGSWVMPDEALTTFEDVVNQASVGHRWLRAAFPFLNETSGLLPRVGWQIDPFGASSSVASLYAMMGFDAHVIDRISYVQKQDMAARQALEFDWTPSASLPGQSILTHTMDFYGYCAPNSPRNLYYFDDDSYWGPDGEPGLNATSAKDFALRLVSVAQTRAAQFRTPNVLFPWGCDFEFHNAFQMFESMDQVVEEIQANAEAYGANITYATVSEYVAAVKASGASLPSRGATDFFPYIERKNAYWTGFYASRSFLKGRIRRNAAVLRSAEIAFTTSPPKNVSVGMASLETLREVNGEVQHHDAIPGTALSFVNDMYKSNMSTAEHNVGRTFEQSVSAALGGANVSVSSEAVLSGLWKAGSGAVPVVVTNSLAWKRDMLVNISLPGAGAASIDGLQSQIVPPLGKPYCPAYARGSGLCDYRLVFVVPGVPPLGMKTVLLRLNGTAKAPPEKRGLEAGVFSAANSFLSLSFNASVPGGLVHVKRADGAVSLDLTQEVLLYPSQYNTSVGVASGAYIFRPSGVAQPPPLGGQLPAVVHTSGDVVEEIVVPVTASPPQFVVYRLVHSTSVWLGDVVHVMCSLGPLTPNTEAIVRWSSSALQSGATFYTDSNMRATHKRTRNMTLSPDAGVTIAGNYYPSAGASFLRDEKGGAQLTVFPDRSHGVSSLASGEFEVMLHRRTHQENADGEWAHPTIPLNDSSVVTAALVLDLNKVSVSMDRRRRAMLQLQHPPRLLFGGVPDVVFQPVSRELPDNVHLMSLQSLEEGMVLRLAHLFEVGESTTLSHNVTVDVAKLLAPLTTIKSWKETTLTGLKTLHQGQGAPPSCTLQPMMIKTWHLQK